MSLGNFLQYSKYRIRTINRSYLTFKRISHWEATIISGCLLLNFITVSTPEDAGKLPKCRILYLICVKISMNQSYERGRSTVSPLRALQVSFYGLVLGKSLIVSFSGALLELSFEKILRSLRHNGTEISFGYSHPHSLWAIR